MAIAFDAASSGSSTASSSSSHSHVIGSGSNRILTVGAHAEDTISANTDVSGITYNGVAMTARVNIKVGTTTLQNTELYDMQEASLPTTGSYTVAITCGGACDSIIGGGISIDGAAQAAPEATATGSNSSSSTSHSTNITTVSSNAWVFDAFGGGTNSALAPQDAGQTERYDVQAGTATGGGSTEVVATASTANLGWTYASVNRVAHALAAYAAAAGAARAQINPLRGPMFMRSPV